MPATSPTRRWFTGGAVVMLVVLALMVATRLTLVGAAVSSLLRRAGASEVKFAVVQASPWQVVVDGLGFRVDAQEFSARRVRVVRPHWWTPSLGSVQVEAARLPVKLGRNEPLPWAALAGTPGAAPGAPLTIPAETVSVDGQVIVRADGLPDEALTVRFAARRTAAGTWTGRVDAAGRGLAVQADGTFDPGSRHLAVQVPAYRLDLQAWAAFVDRLVPLPAGPWQLAGKISGHARGGWDGKDWSAGGTVSVREGRAVNLAKGITAEGVEADVEFVDAGRFATKPGTVRIKEVQTGRMVLRDLAADFAFANADEVVVSRATLATLGGKVELEPFHYRPSLGRLDAVVVADGIDVAEVMALTKGLPAQASGRVDGRLPIKLDSAGLTFGTGWLALKPGVYAQIQFDAAGLLTRGISPKNPSYPVLQKVESGLLKLKVTELRLDIRPPNAPPGRSAQIHVAGEPVDREVKAPVVLDLNVNGPLEQLLNLGLGSRLNFGTKP